VIGKKKRGRYNVAGRCVEGPPPLNTSGAIYLEKRKEEDTMCPSTHLGQHICLCVYIYTYAYSYTYIYMYMNTCMYIHVYIDVV